MSKALVNRIRQRLEARRDFMRSVFSKHHSLTWRMTDAPSLRLLGLTPKKPEPSRPRAVQVPREAKAQPRNARVTRNPELDLQAFETERSFEVTQPTPETTVTDSGFVASELPDVERQSDSSVETQASTVEALPELEDAEQSRQIEPRFQVPSKLEPARALEILERRESSATPELQSGVAPSVRSGETTPPDVSPRANTQNIAPDGVVTPRVQLDEVISSQVFTPEEAQDLEQNEVAAELTKPIETQTVQDANNSIIESQVIQPEKIENPQSNQNQPLTPARASEILRQRTTQTSQPSSSTSQAPNETQKIVPESQRQLEPTVLRETANQTTAALESNENAKLEHQIESNFEPTVVARDAIETPQVSAEIITPAEVPTSRFEAAEPSTPQSMSQPTPKIETREAVREAVIEETRVSEIPSSTVVPREITAELAQTQTPEVVQALQESVLREPAQESLTRELQQESIAREPSQEPMARESQQEFDVQEMPQEPATREIRQEPVARETRTEPQTESGSAQPLAPEQTDWQRSTPGDPQSGVVEIIRAKPPRNLRPERTEKPTEPREEAVKLQTPEARVSQTSENVVQPKQNLSERMKSLQQRFGGTEQTRFDPSTNAFSQRVETDDTQTPAPKFQSISDVAQRLARRYSETPSTTSTEEETSSPDLKVGEQLNETQTRAANEFVQQGTQPVQLRESTRTFLAPLIGFDPSLARVFVGPSATEFTSSLNADGATVATDVYLNNGFDEQSPEGLGLLAHELTHVGQHLQPDFVPPMLQNATQRQDFTGESLETQARAVEARVTNTASMFVPGIPLEATASRQTSTALTTPSNSARNLDAWDGLPAPWEAMPNLNTNATDFVTVIAPSSVGSSSTSTSGFSPVADSSSSAVQLAESDRSAENPDNQPHGAAGGQPHPPAQDMDLLAQQVYEILKRRLSSERRREG
jgi:Domain of unknown function (DUF4157)